MWRARCKRPLEIEDVIAWKALGTPVVSSDGQWFGYRLAPQEGDAEIVLKPIRGDKELRFPAGEQPQGDGGGGGRGGRGGAAASLAFSEDGKWAAFTSYPARASNARTNPTRIPTRMN